MTEIVKTDIKVPPLNEVELSGIDTLPVVRKLLIMAKNSEKVALAEKVPVNETIYQTLKLAEIQSGLSKIINDDLTGLAKQTYDLILDRYPALTISEFQIACRNGVTEAYGQWYGMCLKSVNQWIKGYLNDPEYLQAVKDWNKSIEANTIKIAEKPEFIKMEKSKDGLRNLFARYKETGRMDMLSFAYYEILADLVGIDFHGRKTLVTDKQIRETVVNECKAILERGYKEQKVRAEKRGDFDQAEMITELLTKLDKEGELHRRVKEKFLKIYFDDLIKDNKQLEI